MSGWLKQLIVAVLIGLLLLGGYYVFYLQPKLQSSKRLLSQKNELVKHRQIWLQNQVAWSEFYKLDSNKFQFKSDLDNNISQIEKSIQEAQKENIGEENNWQAQEKMLSEVKIRADLLKNIFEYDPNLDLSVIDIKQLSGRSKAASEGIDRISRKVDSNAFDKQAAVVRAELDKLSNGRVIASTVISEVYKLKQVGFDWVLESVESKDNRDLLSINSQEIKKLDEKILEINKQLNPKE